MSADRSGRSEMGKRNKIIDKISALNQTNISIIGFSSILLLF